MAKSSKKSAPARPQGPVSAAKPLVPGKEAKARKPTSAALGRRRGSARKAPDNSSIPKPNKLQSGTKQSRVLAMLRSPEGATIAAMMQATGWQQHSVRGFLAGVVRKRLKLKLTSKKPDGSRIYQITGGATSTLALSGLKAGRAA